MGRSMSRTQYMKLRDLQRRNVDCRHDTARGGACMTSAAISIEETVTDGKYTPNRCTMRYCQKHWQSVLRMLAVHGVKDGTDVTTVNGNQTCVYHMATVRNL